MALYSDAEMSRDYRSGERITFGGGAYVMDVETADRTAPLLVQRNNQTGLWRRVQIDPLEEIGTITRAAASTRVPELPRHPGNALRR